MSYLVFKVSSVLLSLISIVKSDVQLFDEKEIDIYQSTVTLKNRSQFLMRNHL